MEFPNCAAVFIMQLNENARLACESCAPIPD